MRKRRKLLLWSWSGLFVTWMGIWMAFWFSTQGASWIGR